MEWSGWTNPGSCSPLSSRTRQAKVTTRKIKPTDIDRNGLNIISKSVARVAKKKAPEDVEGFTQRVLANIETTTDTEKAVSNTDLVVEAIIENIKIKRDLFGYLDKKAPASTIFASNTSSLSITEIAEACSDARQAKCVTFARLLAVTCAFSCC